MFFITAGLMIAYGFQYASPESKLSLKDMLNKPLFAESSHVATVAYLSRNGEVPEPTLYAEAALVWDSASSTPLYEKEKGTRRPIASITKFITGAIVLDEVGIADLVTVSARAVSENGDAGGLHEGELLSVEALMAAMLVESSNDAAFALAEYVGVLRSPDASRDPVDVFVDRMNAKIASWNLHNTYVEDPAGLKDQSSYSTAEDLAAILGHLRSEKQYEPVWRISQRSSASLPSADGLIVHTFHSTNTLLDERAGIIGGKTGYTDRAGESMVLVAMSPDETRELYYIVLGSADRFGDMRELINWTTSAYVWVRPLSR